MVACILASNEKRKDGLSSTYLEETRAAEEASEVLLTLPPIVQNGNIELGVVRLMSFGPRLPANECTECNVAAGGGGKGLDIVNNVGEARTTEPVAGARALAAHTVDKL
jgi:hypothetical protein